MKSLDELLADKLISLVHMIMARLIKPDLTFKNIHEINEKMIEEIKQKYGVEGIIIDVDETLRKDLREIPPANKEWLEKLKGKFKVIILSNGMDKAVEDYMTEQGIDYIGFGMKPLKRNFKKACNKMGLKPNQVLVIGNDLFDDIYGGKRNKMWTGLVKEVEK